MNYVIFGIIALVAVIIGVIAFFINRLEIVPPSEALIISGSRGKVNGAKVIPPGGRAFVIPFIQRSTKVNLSQLSLGIKVEGVDENTIPIDVTAVANIKVGSEPAMIRAAAERFSAYKNFDAAIRENVIPILTGSLRTIVAEMTVKTLLTNRTELAEKVLTSAKPELRSMGLDLDSLTVNEISDSNGYISALSTPEAAEVSKAARIAQAEANKVANDAEVSAKIVIAEKQQAYEIRQAELKAKRDAELAKAMAAKPLADAAEEEKIAEAEAKRTEKQALLTEKELEVSVKKPADASLYRATQEAEAEKVAQIAEAQADAEAIKIRGEAEAAAIAAKGAAEAEAMEKKAAAYQMYNEAAMTQLVIDKLPEIVGAYAAPLGSIEGMTVVSADGAGSITNNIAGGIAQIDALVEGITGFSLKKAKKEVAPTTLEVETQKEDVVSVLDDDSDQEDAYEEVKPFLEERGM